MKRITSPYSSTKAAPICRALSGPAPNSSSKNSAVRSGGRTSRARLVAPLDPADDGPQRALEHLEAR